MPAALEGRLQPGPDHALHQVRPEQVRRQAEDVRVVMPPAHLRGNDVMTGSGPGALDLVGADTHPNAGPADQDAAIRLTASDRPRHLDGEVGVVAAVFAMRPDVVDLMAELLQKRDDVALGVEAAVIAADG